MGKRGLINEQFDHLNFLKDFIRIPFEINNNNIMNNEFEKYKHLFSKDKEIINLI